MSRHILIVGGGYVGSYTAYRLQRLLAAELARGDVEITVVDPQSYMTYQPFLAEAAAGNLEPRHVVTPLRQLLRRCSVYSGRLVSLDHAAKRAVVQPADPADPAQEFRYDVLVMATGSISRTLPIPGLAEEGIGFKTLGEAVYLRDHVLGQLDKAADTENARRRRRDLTFVFVGGGFAGVEALAELEDMARTALRYYPTVNPKDLRFVLVEATDRILPEVGPEMGRYTVTELRRRGIDVRLATQVTSAKDGNLELSDGTTLETSTLVWTAGVQANPVLQATDLPLDAKGRVRTTPRLTVDKVRDAFAAGDNAAVPDLTKPGEFCAPNAQHAVRQARLLADNVAAHLQGRPLRPYRHAYVGSVASLGLYKGVAQVYGVKLKGFPAWLMHRTYHLSRMPTFNRKTRILADWTLALLFRREIVSIGNTRAPREQFRSAATAEAAEAKRNRRVSSTSSGA